MQDEAGRQSRETAEAVARRSYGKLVAFLAARMRDVAGAEDALSDAFATALFDWPRTGIPARPEAWLLTVARRKMLDGIRRRQTAEDAREHLRLMMELNATDGAPIPDDRLGLMFACAHPAIDASIRAPLILQTILGFDAAAIASAFLVSPATMGQRLVRAKNKIKQAGIPFRAPEESELADRLDAVLAAIYATFSEGWSDPEGTETRRRSLAEDGVWLGQLVVSLLPDEPEALGLLSLMLHAEARRGARRNVEGDYVPLAEQDAALWDKHLADRAETLLFRAASIGRIGRYQLEAAVQSAHVARRLTGRTDWAAIEQLYTALSAITGSPVVAINRAIAIAEARSPSAGLAALDALEHDLRLSDYQPYWAARAALHARADEAEEALHAYDRAIGLEADPAVRRFLQKQRGKLSAKDPTAS
ncbi:MAG: putative polymerase sigma factor containing a repeat domain [Rhodospirillales bacterium]|nr:putative polymerase sigma factor containing a repeat domain [Rhodospirillales bacterium]